MLQAWKVVVAVVLVGSPAGLGVAAVTGNLSGVLAPAAPAAASDEPSFGGTVVQEFAKTFDAPITAGTLDLRIDDGAIHVFGWDQDAYLVQVLQADKGQAVGDYETVIDFQDNSSGSDLALTLVVEQRGMAGVGANGDPSPETAVVAFVPAAAAYDRVFVCSGQEGDVLPALPDPTPPKRSPAVPEECVPSDGQPHLTDVSLNLLDQGRNAPDVPFGVTDLHGVALVLSAIHTDIQTGKASFETARLVTTYGDLAGEGLDAAELLLATDHGDIMFQGLSAGKAQVLAIYGDVELQGRLDAAQVGSEHGDVLLELSDLQGGSLQVRSTYGDVAVHVPAGEAFGYDVEASTTYGDITIALADAEVERDDGGAAAAGADGPKTATARTSGFADRAVQVKLGIETEHGDVLVTDGSEEPLEEDEEAPALPAVPVPLPAVPRLR